MMTAYSRFRPWLRGCVWLGCAAAFALAGCGRKAPLPARPSAPDAPVEASAGPVSDPGATLRSPAGPMVSAAATAAVAVVVGAAGAESPTNAPVAVPLPESWRPVLAAGDPTNAVAELVRMMRNDPEVLNRLGEVLRHADEPDARRAIEAVAALGTTDAFLSMVRAAAGLPDTAIRRETMAAAATMAASGQPAPVLFEALRVADDPTMIDAAVSGLAVAADTNVVRQAAARYVESQDDAEREGLLRVLRQATSPDVAPAMMDIAAAEAGEVRDGPALAALDTLGVIGSAAAVTALLDRCAGAAPTSAVLAATARLCTPEALPALLAAAEGGVVWASPASRLAAVRALGNYPSAQVAPVLQRLVRYEQDADLRAAAQEALDRTRNN